MKRRGFLGAAIGLVLAPWRALVPKRSKTLIEVDWFGSWQPEGYSAARGFICYRVDGGPWKKGAGWIPWKITPQFEMQRFRDLTVLVHDADCEVRLL